MLNFYLTKINGFACRFILGADIKAVFISGPKLEAFTYSDEGRISYFSNSYNDTGANCLLTNTHQSVEPNHDCVADILGLTLTHGENGTTLTVPINGEEETFEGEDIDSAITAMLRKMSSIGVAYACEYDKHLPYTIRPYTKEHHREVKRGRREMSWQKAQLNYNTTLKSIQWHLAAKEKE